MKAAVIGAGTWGTAFALHLSRRRVSISLWVREKEVLAGLRRTRENRTFLPGFPIPRTVSFSSDAAATVSSADILFIAVPSQFFRAVFRGIAGGLSPHQVVVSLTKGIEERSLKRMTEIMAEVMTGRRRPHFAVLSGPSFAREVAEKHPTAVVVAARSHDVARQVQSLISDVNLRAYTSSDITGVELAGAMKNVIAIAAGISDALKYGHNSRAALVTRGIAEMTRLGVRLGARKETFFGLAGIGDLVLTCTARMSRNYHVGYELGKGRALAEIQAGVKTVAEGVATTVSVRDLAGQEAVEMPITEEVYRVLYDGKDPRDSIRDLMQRALKVES
ncbi:MAG: glycerol-3-phosphate dehydrogenase [Candidatus Aminicenantes bacterium RBG_16_63_16]|nr:MAG: glycerol-3-phosphate dehydrogenase [Candidatus Aminicenantes bacterium RBG_16_63_16]